MNRSRILLAAFLAVLLVSVAMPAQAATWTNLNGVVTTGAGSALAFSTTPGLQAHIYSTAGSSATVVVQGSTSSSGPWITLATVTNPSATGECYQGTPLPYMRANATARASGTLYAVFRDLRTDPGPWAPCASTATATAPTYGVLKYTWTNAEIVAAGTGGTEALLSIGTIPANSQLLSAYTVIGTQATFAAGTLTVGVGRTAATYVDFLAASDAKAAAATVYGNAAAERATDAAIQFLTAATPVKAIFTAGAGDLANVTTSTGTIYLLYVTYP